MLTEAVSVEGAVPLVGLTVNHGALTLAVKLRVPAPVLVTLIVWFAGLAPPAVAVKLRLPGLTPIVGCVGGADVPLYTTSAKSWSVVSLLPGTPSPAMFVALTVTVKLPVVPAGRKTDSRLFLGSAVPPVTEFAPEK